MNPRRRRMMIAVLLSTVAIGYLIFAAMQDNKVYYTTIQEWEANPEKFEGVRIKIGGVVASNSIERNDEIMELKFMLQQDRHFLPVKYSGVVPDAFQDKAEVIVEGRFSGDVFVSDNLLTKCASKYEGEVYPGTDFETEDEI